MLRSNEKKYSENFHLDGEDGANYGSFISIFLFL